MECKVIRRMGEAMLVEWLDADECLRRGVIPVEEYHDGDVDEEVLNAAIPYGTDWENRITLSVTPERIANELRKRGIWTLEDLRRAPEVGVVALQAAYAVDVFTLLLAGSKEVKEDEQDV